MRITEKIKFLKEEKVIKEIYCNFCGTKVLNTKSAGTCTFSFDDSIESTEQFTQFDVCFDCYLEFLKKLAITTANE